MHTLTIEVPEEKAERLEVAARREGLPLDDLLHKLMDEYLDRREKFELACEYVLKKNAALYSSLAQLVDGITDENRHVETQTGPALGNEAW